MKLWKLVGLAGVAGVAAGGVIIARDQRRRVALEPDEVRERLHARLVDPEGPAPGAVLHGPALHDADFDRPEGAP